MGISRGVVDARAARRGLAGGWTSEADDDRIQEDARQQITRLEGVADVSPETIRGAIFPGMPVEYEQV